jgi:uncharacterized protein YjbI with pentapeptide repeats
VLARGKADASVVSAWISAVATFLGVGATAAVAIFAFWYARSTNQATINAANENLKDQREQLDKTFEEQREQLNTTLAAQREQLDSTLAEQRTRTLNERYDTAADKLDSDKPPVVRLAGVHALAGLADDWPENRQTCVDVLCAYLRLPDDPDPGDEASQAKRAVYRGNREVRHTIIRIIGAHLRAGAAVSWQGLNFDFTGVIFDGGDFAGARFSGGKVSFEDAEFSGGTVTFSGAEFSSGAEVDFSGTKFSGGTVHFRLARFSGGTVNFSSAKFLSGTVYLIGTEFSGGMVAFSSAEFSGGTVHFNGAEFSGGVVYFTGAEFSGGTVDFGGPIMVFSITGFRRGAVFNGAEFSGGTVYFGDAKFSGSAVYFSDAKFSGGTVDFSDAVRWSRPPAFPWTDKPPPGVKLPKKEDLS